MPTTRIPLTHIIASIERAMPRFDTHNQHPNCVDCSAPAAVTLETESDVGGRFFDLCGKDFEERLSTDAVSLPV